jgi:hypothetical protein
MYFMYIINTRNMKYEYIKIINKYRNDNEQG